MGGNDLAISTSAVNAPQIETTRLSCTLSILAAQGVATKRSRFSGTHRRGGSSQRFRSSVIDDVLLSPAAVASYSPRQVLWMKQATRGQIVLEDRTEPMPVARTQRRDGAGDEIVVREPGALKQIQQTGSGGGTLSPTTGGGGGSGS
jgi:hypothetical protein